ncbi:hypothetical protein F3Y22_tig00110174pilonHSYRG00091 [Hibiscus syriacus]|uniref:RNase H type-1 domain-containing protein n=1 Tax=Hibiscus syriacus TaxID=106335 RepID=A0A6A3BH30_HIBSY|nr:hypothetical protein F3Y22_tig00110174pilonHSYRG00091 [Hibiscus syriacus]
MGNGNSITFWNDNWVPSLGPLRDYARDDIHADLTQKIHNFVDVHGHWDVAALSQVLIPAVIPYGVTYKTYSIIHSSYSWAKCYETNIRNPTARPRQQRAASTWSSPPRGWTCLNTDGFTKNIGTTSALHAELWSIYEGLLIARSFGVSKLLIQFDCSKAVKLIEDSAGIDSHIPLMRAILKQRRSRCWITKVQWISRNGNKIADKMTKLASWNHFSLIRFDSPPDELVDLL